jgi:hypothetical protein
MSTTATTTTKTAVDPAHPTQEPFTSPNEQSNVNNCTCCGIFLVPLAALGGLVDAISRKIGNIFRSGDNKK